jgi:hypothetical protein
MNSNFLLETKKEYTIRLVNILAPFIYEGFNSIYNDALKVAKEGSELKIFQNFLRRISKWNTDMINRESKRILNFSNSIDFLEDLVRAVIKANIIVLTNTSPDTSINFLEKKQYMNVEFNDFIHKCYIESAREIFNNPYLFFHKYPAIDIKRNQRDTLTLIKESIQEAIRKMLPVQHILKEYLGNNYQNPKDIDVNSTISEVEANNLRNLVNKDLSKNNSQNNKLKKFLIHNNSNDNKPINNLSKNTEINIPLSNNSNNKPILHTSKNLPLQISDNINNSKIIFDNTTNNTSEIRNLISQKINNNNNNNSDNSKFTHFSKKKDIYSIDRKEVLNKLNLNTTNINKPTENHILKNSVYNDVSDSETSISYHINNDEEYEDIFSNVNNVNNEKISSIKSNKSGSNVFLKNNNKSNTSEKNKRLYFEKYKQI